MDVGGANAIKGLLFLVFLQPIFPIIAASSTTTDTSSFRLVSLMILGGILFCAAGILFFVLQDFLSAAATGLGLCGISALGLLVYNHAYNHNWFDVQRKPDDRRTSQATGA